jgi:hypothetical protein
VRRVLLVQGSTRPLPSPCPCPVPPRHGRMGYLAPAGGELASAVHGRRAAAHAHLDSGGQRAGMPSWRRLAGYVVGPRSIGGGWRQRPAMALTTRA